MDTYENLRNAFSLNIFTESLEVSKLLLTFWNIMSKYLSNSAFIKICLNEHWKLMKFLRVQTNRNYKDKKVKTLCTVTNNMYCQNCFSNSAFIRYVSTWIQQQVRFVKMYTEWYLRRKWRKNWMKSKYIKNVFLLHCFIIVHSYS